MHGSLAANAALLGALKAARSTLFCDMLVCAPFPYLGQLGAELAGSGISWGAQTLSEHEKGAFTGEVSASMLVDLGCSHVLVGHSERRSLYGESDTQVAAKLEAALKAALVPVLCVGETLQERESGVTEQVIERQLRAVVDRVGVSALAGAVVAYEPVWAIGTGRSATPEQAQAVHAFIRALVANQAPSVAESLLVLYGGSVKPDNAGVLFGQRDIDGALVGGASLIATDFIAIARAAG